MEEAASEVPEVYLVDVEVILLVSQSLLLEDFYYFCDQLIRVVDVHGHLLLHVAAYVHPLVEFHNVFVLEISHDGLYVY